MAYLQPTDYPNYGLPAGTTADWITAATALDQQLLQAAGSECDPIHRAAAIDQGAQTVLLSYLPLAPLGTATTPIVSIEGRYAQAAARRVAERAADGDRMGVFAAWAMDGDRSRRWTLTRTLGN